MDKAQTNPFKGLRAYAREDSGTLFGRERDLTVIYDRLFSGRTTLLFAGSGAGKTSFLRARLMPEAESRQCAVFYHGQWSTGEPLAALCRAVQPAEPLKMAAVAGGGDARTRVVKGSPPTLAQSFAQRGAKPTILILDHFEEVFHNHSWRSYFERFIDALCEVINQASLHVRVLFSMREEFLGELSAFDNRIPDLFNNYYRLKHPNEDDAKEIIRQTCALAGAQVNESGLKQLIDDLSLVERAAAAGTASAPVPPSHRLHRDFVFLPYVQVVCRQLWEETQSLPAAPFLSGYRPGMAGKVLNTFCREKLSNLDDEQKKTVAATLEYLVSRQGAKVPCELRNLASLTRESPSEIETALNRLSDEDTRILRVTRAADGSKWFELYHDLYAPVLRQWKHDFEAETQDQEQKRSRQLVGEAELFLRATAAMFEDEKGSPAADSAATLSLWARLVERQGDRGGAARLLQRVLAVQEERLGESHPDVALTLAHLARLVKPAKAERMLRRALQIQESTLGPEHESVAVALIDLAKLLRGQHREVSAEPLLRRALCIQERALGAEHPDVISLVSELTSLLRTLGRDAEANALFRRAVDTTDKPRDDELGKWIRVRAAEISQDRKFRRLMAPIEDLLTRLRDVASSSEETLRDWHDATILLAVEILDGRIDFARHIDPSSYWRLEEDSWLQDVKHSKAYGIWLDRGGGTDLQKEIEDYIRADEQVRARLLDPAIKATIDEFAPVHAYLNRRYITNEELDSEKSGTAKLVGLKAFRFWQATGASEIENWNRAERYCKLFYGNIIPAVTRKSLDHVRAVLAALEIPRGIERADVAVNCFEMAIAIYFLDPAAVSAALGRPSSDA